MPCDYGRRHRGDGGSPPPRSRNSVGVPGTFSRRKNGIVCENGRFSIVWKECTTDVEDNHNNEGDQNGATVAHFPFFARLPILTPFRHVFSKGVLNICILYEPLGDTPLSVFTLNIYIYLGVNTLG